MTNPVFSLMREFFGFRETSEEHHRDKSRRLKHLEKQVADIHALLTTLKDKVNSQDSVIQGVQTTVATLSAALKEAKEQIASDGDVEVLNDIIKSLDDHNASLAQAVANNTAASSEPTPTTPAEPVTTDSPSSSDNSGAATGTATDNNAGNTTNNPAPTSTDNSSGTTTTENPTPAPATETGSENTGTTSNDPATPTTNS